MAAQVGTTTAPGSFLAPYVPSPEVVVHRMLEIARVGPGDTVYDLGSGDGRVVVAAAQRFGARALGVELDDQRFTAAAARVRDLGLATRATIVHGDLASVDLRAATVVTLYQLPSVNEMLRPALERQLRAGARVVTHDFPINGWSPSQVVTGRLDDGSQHAIYLYTVGETRKESAIMAIDSRSYVSMQASLELEGVTAGALKSFEGGEAMADVVVEKVGADHVARKHIAGVTYTELEFRFGMGMSNDLYDWIAATLQQKSMRKNGAVVMADYDFKAQSRQDFFHGIISEIGFPACDGSVKEASFMTLKVSPEYTRMVSASGQKVSSSSSYGKKSANLLPSNFRLTIGGLDCSRVTKIDALVVKQKISSSAIGELRDYEKEPSGLEIPNLAISLADDGKNGFREWFDEFVVKGNTSVEKNGTLEFLSANQKDPLIKLTFSNLGIFKLTRDKFDAQSEQIRRLRAEMYCEELAFSYGVSASTGTGTSASQSAGTGGGTASSQGGSANSGAAASPIYVRPFVASVADKLQVLAEPQNLVAAPRLGRPLKFRS